MGNTRWSVVLVLEMLLVLVEKWGERERPSERGELRCWEWETSRRRALQRREVVERDADWSEYTGNMRES